MNHRQKRKYNLLRNQLTGFWSWGTLLLIYPRKLWRNRKDQWVAIISSTKNSRRICAQATKFNLKNCRSASHSSGKTLTTRRKSDTTRWERKTSKDIGKRSRRKRMRFTGLRCSKESWSKLNNYLAKKAALIKMANMILCKPAPWKIKAATVVPKLRHLVLYFTTSINTTLIDLRKSSLNYPFWMLLISWLRGSETARISKCLKRRLKRTSWDINKQSKRKKELNQRQ